MSPSEIRGDLLRGVLALIAAVTILSGAAQLVAPGFVLGVLGAESTPTTRYLFGIVGMFMVVVGGVFLQGLLSGPLPRYVVFWAGLQKLGAAVAVGSAVWRDLMATLALAVALFDFATAVLCFVLWLRLAGNPARPRAGVSG